MKYFAIIKKILSNFDINNIYKPQGQITSKDKFRYN